MSHVKLDVRVLFQTDFKRIVKTTCLNLHKSSLTSEELLIIMNTRAFKQSSNSGKRLLKWSHGNVTVLPRFASMTGLILRLLQDFVGLIEFMSQRFAAVTFSSVWPTKSKNTESTDRGKRLKLSWNLHRSWGSTNFYRDLSRIWRHGGI